MRKVTVTVADDHVGDIEDVVERLRSAGMTVDQVLGPVGVITGSVQPSGRSALEALAGVAAVEEETEFRLPPPDSETQ
jgi:hypothetical protein